MFQKIDAARADGYARLNTMTSVSSDGDLSDASVYSNASGLEVNGMAHENQRSVETQWSLGYSTIGVWGIGGALLPEFSF